MLITEYYRQQNVTLHKKRASYGSRERIARYREIESLRLPEEPVLDYGCGKASMSRHLKGVTNYDPAGYPKLPEPHGMVVCMDVLEHVEPECLNDVLQHIASLTQRLAYLVISKAEHGKMLPDGRYSHLIVKPPEWWHVELEAAFRSVEFIRSKADEKHDMTFLCRN